MKRGRRLMLMPNPVEAQHRVFIAWVCIWRKRYLYPLGKRTARP